MRQLNHIIAVIIVIFASATAWGLAPFDSAAIIDSLTNRLQTTRSASDSMSIMCDLYDLNIANDVRSELAEDIYSLCTRHGNDSLALAMIRHLANLHSRDSVKLNDLASRTATLPPSNERNETQFFVNLIKIDNTVNADTFSDLSEDLSQQIKEYRSDTISDPYRQAEILYSLCCHLRLVNRGNVLVEYYKKLENKLNELPLGSGAVRNLIYSRAAPIFTINGDYEHAIEIDRRLLNIVDSLEMSYKSRGRRFRTLNNIRYVTLTRMLSNYPGLTTSEIEKYYAKVKDLAERDPRVAADMVRGERAEIYYNLAKGNDKEAVEGIKRQLKKLPKGTPRAYLLSALQTAALKMGDRATAGEAALELNDILKERIESHAEELYRELQVIYDVHELTTEREELLRTRHAAEIRISRLISAISILLLVIVGIALAMFISKNRQIKAISDKLKESAQHLRQERNQLCETQEELIEMRDQAKAADKLKTDFIHNLSHEVQTPLAAIVEYSRLIVDCIPDKQSKYLNRFADIIDLNTRLILTLVNDILDIASLERDKMSLTIKPTSIHRICEFAIDDIFENRNSRNPAVKFTFNPENKPDFDFNTDGTRVAQVLINLLDNAEKFTESGRITLDYTRDETAGNVTFTVTDTGIGIPKGKDAVIFSCFRQLDQTSSGCGLGLYVSRLIAQLLGGTLEVDTAYRGGARFIFTIPLDKTQA